VQDDFMRSVAAVLFLLLGSYLCTGQTGKVETLGPPTDPGIPESVKGVLQTAGQRLVLDDGSTLCEIWLRKTVPVQAKKDAANVVYPELGESTLIGLVSFPHATTDYRGQAIKAGAYTLRYELIPEDGNHLGVAPNRDFVLLIPAASDPDPNATFKFDELVNLSREATGTRHPAPFSLVQPSAATGLSEDEEDHWIFSTVLKLESGKDLPIAVVVKGTTPQ
jgi:rRNA maturation protein Nop10